METYNPMAMIEETRCTCRNCGHVWFYGKGERAQHVGASMQEAGKAMMCCTGCVPALMIPTKQTVDPTKCPQCGSRAADSETIVHDLDDDGNGVDDQLRQVTW